MMRRRRSSASAGSGWLGAGQALMPGETERTSAEICRNIEREINRNVEKYDFETAATFLTFARRFPVCDSLQI
jgi:hypothetical protein